MTGTFPPVHEKPERRYTFERLDRLWERYPQYHEPAVFSAMEDLVEEHESWKEGYEEIREEYQAGDCDRFLVQLSWSDLYYRQETRKLIEASPDFQPNPYVVDFMKQFEGLDTDREACFLIPESFLSQFIVVMEVCKRAKALLPVRNLFPDEETVHYLAVFDKRNLDDVLLMHHLDTFGGYSLYDYPLIWYQTHLCEQGVVLRSPYLPDGISKYLGSVPFCFDPAKTVAVRRNIAHILESGFFSSELDFFLNLTRIIMPFFQWWYDDLSWYETRDGFRTEWRLERTRIRTELTAEGIIKPRWKHELSLFSVMRKLYPDTLYQYRPEWLGRQSLDLYIPSRSTAIEYQGIQHYLPVTFFGGEDALTLRRELDQKKKDLCKENGVRLIEWPYAVEPTEKNAEGMLTEN